MFPEDEPLDPPAFGENGGTQPSVARVQCPNCCRLARVTGRNMGLLFYRCELCETVGATPDPDEGP